MESVAVSSLTISIVKGVSNGKTIAFAFDTIPRWVALMMIGSPPSTTSSSVVVKVKTIWP